jgi:hypothetical protein
MAKRHWEMEYGDGRVGMRSGERRRRALMMKGVGRRKEEGKRDGIRNERKELDQQNESGIGEPGQNLPGSEWAPSREQLRAAALGHFAGSGRAPSSAKNDGEARKDGAWMVPPVGEWEWAEEGDREKGLGWEWDERQHEAIDGWKKEEDFDGQDRG